MVGVSFKRLIVAYALMLTSRWDTINYPEAVASLQGNWGLSFNTLLRLRHQHPVATYSIEAIALRLLRLKPQIFNEF